MNIFNQITTAIFNVIFYPLQNLSSFWALFIISILTGLFMLWVFKRVSNQNGIRITKNRIKAHLLAIRLYKNDAILSLQSMGLLFKENGRYLLYALKPMLVLSLPVMIIVIQVGSRYGYQSANINEPLLVHVQVAKDVDMRQVALFAPSDDIRVEKPPLYIPPRSEIYWRIYPLEAGVWTLTFSYRNHNISKKIVSGPKQHLSAPKRVSASIESLLYPAESVLSSDSCINEISVDYSENRIKVAGIRFHWLLFFILLSIVTGFAFKGVFRVQI